jgi:putative DeoR family transcriptional regulator (stage III sporulation protein D)
VIELYKSIEERIYKEARCFIDYYSTVREVAMKFNVSKSTVHKDLTERLKKLNYNLYLKVQKVFTYNKQIRHVRGGESTRKKHIKS